MTIWRLWGVEIVIFWRLFVFSVTFDKIRDYILDLKEDFEHHKPQLYFSVNSFSALLCSSLLF